eukprot:TRINITY_DN47888_c0_g1_i1.p1 TRINITY_DN47888_c0_g1~~TRINITY_DN47888_c0_g1_i1.p1  ORF type:complete len:566 (+),score=74.79 TRINITY_DN47888_c0_g1_i1:311-2008(+)
MNDTIELVRTRRSFTAIPDVAIPVDEPVWNVIVFICLNLIALPVLEFLSDLLVRKTATMKLLKDRRVLLSDSRLGILSLYSTYYGRRRSLMIMVFLGVTVIVMETFAEFCSSSAEFSEKTQRDVWNIEESHNYSYIHGGRQGRNRSGAANVNVREERLESVLNSKDCIFGVEDLVLRLNDSRTSKSFEPVIRAHYMNARLSSSKLYLASDNSSIVCDYFRSKPEKVEVWMPAVRRQNATYVTAPALNSALRTNSRPPINWSRRVRFGQSLHTVYGFRNGRERVNRTLQDSYTCLQMDEEEDCDSSCESVACAIYAMRDYTMIFGFGEGSVTSSGRGQIVDIKRWRMEFKRYVGEGPKESKEPTKSKEPKKPNGSKQSKESKKSKEDKRASRSGTLSERTIRFVMRMYLEGYLWASENEEVERRRVVTMARYVQSISNELEVNGRLRKVNSLFIQSRPDMVRQVPTVTALVAIPLSLFFLIVVVQLLMLRRLERKIRMRKTVRSVGKGMAKVETSMQWFRSDLVKMLNSNGYRAELDDVSLKLVSMGGKTRLGILHGLNAVKKWQP